MNLDKLAAERAQAMVQNTPGAKIDTLERLCTKALGVLQEQGVYALMLFLFSRSSDEKAIAPHIRQELYQALRQLPGFPADPPTDQAQAALPFFTTHVLHHLDTTLLVRDLYEQTLIYARYAAKAADAGGGA